MRWTVIMPMSELTVAKSRLVRATANAAEHRDLVVAMRSDAVGACLQAALVARLLIVTGEPTARQFVRPGRVEMIPDATEPGLNAAVRAGQRYARRWPEDGIAALVSDLPCLSGASVDEVLGNAARWPRALVVDHTGTGTTMLLCHPGGALDPQFGPGSAQAHRRSGATALPADQRIRCDVDTPTDLEQAESLGVGPATAAALARRRRRTGPGPTPA